jgi:hypothetical protein
MMALQEVAGHFAIALAQALEMLHGCLRVCTSTIP